MAIAWLVWRLGWPRRGNLRHAGAGGNWRGVVLVAIGWHFVGHPGRSDRRGPRLWRTEGDIRDPDGCGGRIQRLRPFHPQDRLNAGALKRESASIAGGWHIRDVA